MTALSADNTKPIVSKLLSPDGFYVDAPIYLATTIYKWSFVGLNETGYLVQYVAPAAGTTVTGNKFIGISVEHVAAADVVASGDRTCRVLMDGYFTAYLSGVAITDVLKPVFASDDNTLTLVAGNGACVGYIVAYDRSGYCTIKLVPNASWAGKELHVTSPAMDYATVNQFCLLVHELENPNGMLLQTASLYTTEAHVCTSTAGIITITHTRGTNTSMGCTLTAKDTEAIGDLIPGVGGQLIGHKTSTGVDVTASGDALVVAPAGTAVIAKVTTASNDGTIEAGQGNIIATFRTL